jgi:hypothetical protein
MMKTRYIHWISGVLANRSPKFFLISRFESA